MNGHSIKINAKDIFDYIIGETGFDPLEKQIDPTRFSISEKGIFDKISKNNFYLFL